MCVEEYGVAIINDISAGNMDEQMFSTIARLGVPYIIMHMKGTPQNMQENPQYDHFLKEIFYYFSEKVQKLRDLGVKDIIIDPGFGFAKTLEHNYAVYPYDAQSTLTEQGVIATTIADAQLYDDQNDLQYAVMVAKSATTSLNFTNAASLLRCHLNTAIGGTTLTSIKVVSASKAIAGAVEIDMAEENPVAVVTNGVQEITLDTEDTELTDAYTVFNIALAANEFPAGDLKVVYTVMIDGEVFYYINYISK